VSLASNQLDAFAVVARTLHFSRAARQLHITQSALSQRIKNLEDELGLSLFSRGPTGVQLTEAGARLLRYCQTKDQLEAEILSDLVSDAQGELAGVIRIAGYSSIMRSVVMPALAPLLREHPKVQAEFITREMRDLQSMLSRGEAEFVLLDREVARAGIESRKLGEETYVLAESSQHRSRAGVYLDHDPDDPLTHEFLHASGQKGGAPLQRSFMGDIYGILDGVAQGLGRAVVPRHLIGGDRRIRVIKSSPSRSFPIVLHYHSQPVYPRLHRTVLEELVKNWPDRKSSVRN
jgi:DNA-binding transcriptional LysR family regulator